MFFHLAGEAGGVHQGGLADLVAEGGAQGLETGLVGGKIAAHADIVILVFAHPLRVAQRAENAQAAAADGAIPSSWVG